MAGARGAAQLAGAPDHVTASSDNLYPSWSRNLLEVILAKGPCRETEKIYRAAKNLHKEMLAVCKPLSPNQFVIPDENGSAGLPSKQLVEEWVASGKAIILTEDPLTFGVPPGTGGLKTFTDFEERLGAFHRNLLEATKLSDIRTAEAHSKLVSLVKKIKVILEGHRRQYRMDLDFQRVGRAFLPIACGTSFDPLGIREGRGLDQSASICREHGEPTEAAANLAFNSERRTVLLCPSQDGNWASALRVAKKLGFVKQDFPDMDVFPLSRIAAIQITAWSATRRQGLRKVTSIEGSLLLITAAEFQILEKEETPRVSPDYEGKLEVWWSRPHTFETGWIPQIAQYAEGALLVAELQEVNTRHLGSFCQALDEHMSQVRWFCMKLKSYKFRTQRYSSLPMHYYPSGDDMWEFAKAVMDTRAVSLLEQLPQSTDDMAASDKKMLLEAKSTLDAMLDIACPGMDETSTVEFEEMMEEERDEDEGGRYEYLSLLPGLGSDILHQPLLNVEQAGRDVQQAGPGTGLSRPQPSVQRPGGLGDRASASSPPAQRHVTHHTDDRPRSRASSGGSWDGEALDRRGAGARPSPPPPSATASQWRGEDKTHSIALQLQRARQQLNAMTADPESTSYKEQRKNVREMLLSAQKHLTNDTDISQSYEEYLISEMDQTEVDCRAKDDELDIAQRARKKIEDDKKDLLATLPRGLGAKFSGTAAEYPGFRHYFVEINQSVNGPLAVSHMTALIDSSTKEGKKLAKRLKIYKNGDELIADLDRDFGHSFLNCQNILNKMNQLARASTESQELDIIVQFRQAKRSLDLNADHEKLLNVPQLIQWADLLLPGTCKELMKIIQEKGFGEDGSATEKYFAHLEQVYERNSVLTRNREARMPVVEPKKKKPYERGLGSEEASQRAYGLEDQGEGGCKSLCKTGKSHAPHVCPLLKDGKVYLKQVQKAGLCTCCVAKTGKCIKGQFKRKDGVMVDLTCRQCKRNKRINCHQNCSGQGQTNRRTPQQSGGGGQGGQGGHGGNGGGGNGGPPVPLNGPVPAEETVTGLRTEISVINPQALGTALETVDYALLVAPDGSTIRVRTIYDNGGSDCMVDWKLERYFHHKSPVTVGVNGANGTRRFRSEIGELKLVDANGAMFSLKALKSDLSGKAFTVRRKYIDIPASLHHHFGPTYQLFNEMGDLRHYNISEGASDQIRLVIGLDAIALSPIEIDRAQDENGQLIMMRSVISNQILVSGSRKTGHDVSMRNDLDHRSYVIMEEDEQPVKLLRTAVDLAEIEDSRGLFVKRKNLTKVEKKFFEHIEDNDQLVPRQPEQCPSCQGCEVCKDPFKARRDNTVNNLMDQLVTFQEGPREDGGGYHIRLIYDPELLAKVAEGKQAALKRLLSTERQLLKPEMKGALYNFNKKMQQCVEKGYMVAPEEINLPPHLQKSYQPISFALKDEEKINEGQQETKTSQHKMKARPVVDSSSVAEPGSVSVNSAQYKIPDIHTKKITEILLQLRTAKYFMVGDISEYYFRFFCDPVTSSLTRVLFRRGGLGSNGEIIELVPKVASMGMREISAFAAHVRYRVSLKIKDQDPVAAEQLRGSYCDDISLFQSFYEHDGGHHEEEGDHNKENLDSGGLLVKRALLVEEALNQAHLYLGDKWVTDITQGVADRVAGLQRMNGVEEDTDRAVSLGSSCHTSALGYRLHLGHEHPEGGSILWKVHRPESLNLEPKRRGARPAWAQLGSEADIQAYLQEQGVSKAGLLSLTSSLFDPLLLAGIFISTARQLFRKILREVGLPSWKSKVPERYHEMIFDLAKDLLQVSRQLKLPRLAVVKNSVASDAKAHPCGFVTLLIVHDGSSEAAIAAAYVHQMMPYESGRWGAEADFSQVTVSCRLLAAAVKLTDNRGHNCQVSGELLSKFIACRLKDSIVDSVLIKFDQILICGDSLTVEKAIRKSDAAFNLWAGRRVASIQRSIDVDCSYHVPHTITDSILDAGTKYQKKPSKYLNSKWFQGEGVLDKPIQQFPFTDRALYAFPRIGDLPSQWLSTAARTFLGLSLPAVVIMKMDVTGEPPQLSLLEELANRHHSVEKAVTVLQYILKMKKEVRELPLPEQRQLCFEMFVAEDYDKVEEQLKKSKKITKELVVDKNDEKGIILMRGRFGYAATLLASPKSSSFSRLVCRDAHQKHHLTNSARIMAKIGRSFLFTGGGLAFLDQLRTECQLCKLLKPQMVRKLLGDIPEAMRGPLPGSVTTWQHQSVDLFGPWYLSAFPKSRATRGNARKLKTWGLVLFDYSSRAIEAQLCENYTTDSVVLSLKACWARVGKPDFLNFDAASNITAAGEILGGGEDLEQPTVLQGEQLQRGLQQQLMVAGIQMRPRVPLAPHRQVSERAVQFCKRQLRQMLQESVGGLITTMEASALLTCAIAHINERPLVLHGAHDELGILTPWYLSQRNMRVDHSQRTEDVDLDSPLSRRAYMMQQRLQLFKGMFDTFYHRQLVRYGKWNVEGQQPQVGDVCLILDKQRQKQNFLARFQLGRIKQFNSEHVCEITFVKQTPEVTAALIKDLKNQSPSWRDRYKVQVSSCVRDVRQLSILTSSKQEEALRRGIDVDMFLDQPHIDPRGGGDADGGDDGHHQQQRGGAGSPADDAEQVQPEEQGYNRGDNDHSDFEDDHHPIDRKRSKPIKEKWVLKK